MNEKEKFGLLILFLCLDGYMVWGFMMLHNDLLRIGSKIEKIIRRLENNEKA